MKQYEIIHEHDRFMVLHKMPGCLVHGPATTESEVTLVELLQKDFPGAPLFPSHRLDKDTSGLMLIAKDKETNSLISQAFEEKKIGKLYVALSNKKPKKKQGWVKGDMEKTRNGSWKLNRRMENPAITYFQSCYLPEMGKRLFLLKPHTGKTHQLRVALKSLGAPILGDQRYKGTSSDRLYLHAYRLSFSLFDKTFTFSLMPTVGDLFIKDECVKAIDELAVRVKSIKST